MQKKVETKRCLLGPGGPLDALLSTDVQVVGADQLEVRIVLDGLGVSSNSELVAPDKLGKEDLDLGQSKVEANTHARALGKGSVGALGSVLDGVGVPAVGVEAARVLPDLLVVVDVVEGRDDNGVLGQSVAAGQDHVDLGGTAGLVRGVVLALGLLDELVKEGQLGDKVGVHDGVVSEVVVDELLQQALLVTGVGDQAVDEPGQEGRGGGEASTGGDDEGGGKLVGRQLHALGVLGAEEVVDNVLGLESSILELEVVLALGGAGNGLHQHGLDSGLGEAESLGVAKGHVDPPRGHGRDALVELEVLGNTENHFVERSIDALKVAKVHAEDKLADSLGAKLEHVLVDVPGLALLVELVKDLEGLLERLLHRGHVVADGLGAESRRQELVGKAPLLGVGVTKENTGLETLDGEEGVAGDNLLGEELALSKDNVGEGGVVGLVDGAAHGVGDNQRAVLFKQALVVAEMVGEDFEVVAKVGNTAGSRDLTDSLAIDGDADGLGLGGNILDGGKSVAVVDESNACGELVSANLRKLRT